jgi:hypothetical protein
LVFIGRVFLSFARQDERADATRIVVDLKSTRISLRRDDKLAIESEVRSKKRQNTAALQKRGRHCERSNFACVLDCGGAPPLFDATE